MDIGKAFRFVFDDEEWVSKVLIGGLIFLIPLVGQLAVVGYSLQVTKNVMQANPRPLPTWSEFGAHLIQGFYAFVIQLVYSIPSIILALILSCLSLSSSIMASDQEHSAVPGGLIVLSFCLVPLIILCSLISAVLSYPAIGRYLMTNTLSEAFKFKEVIAQVRTYLGAWVMLIIVAILAGFVGGLGVIACGIGVLFTSFYAQCVLGHALGQTLSQQQANGNPGTQPPFNYGPPPSYQ